MSQHRFMSESIHGNVFVGIGYDRPLDGYFFFVEDADQGIVYDGLFEKNPYPKTLESWIAKAMEFGITFPEGLLAEVENDFLNKVGNKFKNWDS